MAEKVEFYRETEFKDTEIGRIPKEWEVMVATDVADYINGYPFSPTDWKMYGIPIIRIQNLNDPNAEFNFFDGEIDDIYKIKNGDLLFSWSASIGIYIWKHGDAVLNQHIFKVVPKANINKLFLYYDLLLAIEQLKGRVHGSTMKHFQKNELKTTFIPIPPLEEQQKIAEILSTIDEAIQKTNDIIAKTERLKRGLMQELLTKGIGHKEFKDTEIGRIPKEWEAIRFGDIVNLVKGRRPKEFVNERIKDSLPYLSAENLRNNNAVQFVKVSDDIILVDDGDLILIWDGSNAGEFFLGKRGVLSSTMVKILLKKKLYDSKFLFYLLKTKENYLKDQTKGTGIPHVDETILRSLVIPLPPSEEQQKIAEILSTVDEAIQKTDDIIAKTERLKKGLMQELLTRGIGHKEFKDTEIGKIPKEWEVVNLEGACVEITDGSHWSPKQVERSEYRIATVANLRETYIDIDSCKFISEEDYIRLVKQGDVPRKDDILFSKDGTIGITFTFKQDFYKIGLLSSIAIIRPNHEFLFSDFGAYALKSPNILMQITGWKTGTALRRITLSNLKRLKIMLPPLQEQQKIAEILSTVDKKLETLKQEKVKLERIKQWFMEELLSGRIRVRVA